jgi:splicing factor 3A subunit 3
MASTLLEQTREGHEECERLERAIVTDFKSEAVTHKERLLQNHRVNRMLDEMVTKTKRLVRPQGCTTAAREKNQKQKTCWAATQKPFGSSLT